MTRMSDAPMTMKKRMDRRGRFLAALGLIGTAAVAVPACSAAPVGAAAPAGEAAGVENAFFSQRSLTLEMALDLAHSVLAACREAGWQVSVAVVDRGGNLQTVLRDSRAGARTTDAAIGKAYTALSYRTSSQEMAELTQAGLDPSGMRFVPGSLHVGGGERIWARGENVGAVGVAGAPAPADDVQCVTGGLEEFTIHLDLAS